jgi:hypothetical protein
MGLMGSSEWEEKGPSDGGILLLCPTTESGTAANAPVSRSSGTETTVVQGGSRGGMSLAGSA